jgi:formiminotetrahydrofolate cyclodeaminase
MAARYADDEDAAARMTALRARFLELAEEDAEAYAAVLAAHGLERAEALSRAADAPLELAELGAAVAARSAELAEKGNPNLRGDAVTAVLLAAAATKAAANLVEINLARSAADRRIERARAAAAGAAEASRRALRS